MSNADREWTHLDDDEGNRFHAIWSRSGKRLIVTVMAPPPGIGPMRQVELRPEQVEDLITFLSETVARKPNDR